MKIPKILDRTSPVIYVHMADLLYPHKGRPTQEQLLIASRVLDIREYRKTGEAKFPWQKRVLELRTGAEMSEREEESRNRYFAQLIDHLDQFGLNPNIDVIKMAAEPFVTSEGTHRLGYLCSFFEKGQSNQLYLPVAANRKTPRFDLDGKRFYTERGMTAVELVELEQEYKRLVDLALPKVCIVGFLDASLCTEEVQKLLASYGEITWHPSTSLKLLTENGSLHAGCVAPTADELKVFSLRLKKQYLYLAHGKMGSKTVDSISRKLKEMCGTKWGYIASSVTESVQLYLQCDTDGKKRITK